MKWASFWDSYESAIHNNRELSDIDKFNHLRLLLEHFAYDAIAGLTLITANNKKQLKFYTSDLGTSR